MKFGECLSLTSNTNNNNDIFNNFIKNNENPSVLQSKETGEIFGLTYANNRKILQYTPIDKKNDNAIPNNGELYAIVRKKFIDNTSPYHISFVIYTHENINIALEASADSEALFYPKFSFYDITPGYLNTFHNIWSYSLPKSETIVLNARDISTVLQEIENENINPIPQKKKGGRKTKKQKTKNKKTKIYKRSSRINK